MSVDRSTGPRARIGAAGAVALVTFWLGLVVGWTPPLLAMMAVALSGLTWVLLRWFPARAVVAGLAALLLGSATLGMQPAEVPVGVGDIAILGMLVPVALLGSRFASSMRPADAEGPPDVNDGRWFTIVVAGQGPAPGAGRPARVPQKPRNDPERRRLSRRVERRRELVGAGAE